MGAAIRTPNAEVRPGLAIRRAVDVDKETGPDGRRLWRQIGDSRTSSPGDDADRYLSGLRPADVPDELGDDGLEDDDLDDDGEGTDSLENA